jgi:glycosyltransferase involved in cell wall biosynthesis
MFQIKLWRRWRGVFDLVVANSTSVKRRLLAEGIAPVQVVGNGVSPRRTRASFSQVPTVAFAGRLVPEKGVDVLVRAFAAVSRQISAAKLIICGEGPERPAIEQLVSDLGLADSVSMTGHRPTDDIARIFETAWVVAVPSKWDEPFGHVAISCAMARPVF